MDKEFNERVQKIARKAKDCWESLETEEVTKTTLIFPMLSALGYDVSDHNEVYPEFIADRGMKKAEKVDIAILKDGYPAIMIECKAATECLDNAKYDTQLWRYYGALTTANIAVLTNGVQYRFYTELDEKNAMDEVPFLEIDLLDLRDNLVAEMERFRKSEFDAATVFSHAEELKYSRLIYDKFADELASPSDKFVSFFLDGVYEGKKTGRVVEKYRPLVKRTLQSFIGDGVRERLAEALKSETEAQEEASLEQVEVDRASKIVTTEEEMEAYYIIRGILAGHVPTAKVAYRDAESYFSVLYDDNNRKPICRIDLDARVKHISIPDEKKNFKKYDLGSVEDIYLHKDELIRIATFWAEQD